MKISVIPDVFFQHFRLNTVHCFLRGLPYFNLSSPISTTRDDLNQPRRKTCHDLIPRYMKDQFKFLVEKLKWEKFKSGGRARFMGIMPDHGVIFI